MPQSLTKIWIHIIFSTKNREPLITPAIESELYAYMNSIMKSFDSPCPIINGTPDHVHLLCMQSKNNTIPKLVQNVKESSSKWIKTKGIEFQNYHWQKGYGAFSISQSHIQPLKNYINNQKSHHKKISFQDEYRKILHNYEIQFDERYVWD